MSTTNLVADLTTTDGWGWNVSPYPYQIYETTDTGYNGPVPQGDIAELSGAWIGNDPLCYTGIANVSRGMEYS